MAKRRRHGQYTNNTVVRCSAMATLLDSDASLTDESLEQIAVRGRSGGVAIR